MKDNSLQHSSILIKKQKKTKRGQKKLESDIQGAVKTKRKVTNLLKRFQAVESNRKMEGQRSSSTPTNKPSSKVGIGKTKKDLRKDEENVENRFIDIDIASSESGADEEFLNKDQHTLHSSKEKGPGRSTSRPSRIEIPSSEEEEGIQAVMELQESDSEDSVLGDPADAVHSSMKKFEDKVYYRKLDGHSLLVSINPFKSLYFSGKLAIKVLKGAVEICGYQMTRNQPVQEAFSPKGHSSLLYIRGVSRQSEFDGVEVAEEFRDILLTPDELEDLPGAVLILKAFDNEWAEGLRHFLPHGESLVGPSVTGMGTGKLPKMRTFLEKMGFQFVPQFMREKSRLFETSPVWDHVFGAIKSSRNVTDEVIPPRICIFGGKGVGKSTFTRWMVNKFLSSGHKAVLYIDLDPGQAEFTPPGVVSATVCREPVLGPNFTHLIQPIRSIFVGGVNVADFPVSYLNALIQLNVFASKWDEDLARTPWIINTMGFSQGLGVELAVGCINIFRPSNVIQLSINNERRSYPFNLNVNNVKVHKSPFLLQHLPNYTRSSHNYNFISVESVCNRLDGSNESPWGVISPKSLRENVMASYFSKLIGSTNDCNFLSVLPRNIALNEIAIGTMNSCLKYDGVVRSMKGNLVALCEFPAEVLSQSRTTNSSGELVGAFIPKAGEFPNRFYGYGIVRAFDNEQKVLHVVTPLDEDLRARINAVIVAGDIGLPIQFYIGNTNDKSGTSSEVPYVMNMQGGKSKLHTPSKKYFAQKKTTHNVLRNSLL